MFLVHWISKGGILLFFLAACLLAPMGVSAGLDPLSRAMEPGRPGVAIELAAGNWGSADRRDIQLLLESVAGEFLTSVGHVPSGRLRIRVLPRGGSPRVLYDRSPDGEYLVQLTARDERWPQYAYQFSHELCHILSNFDHKERAGETVDTGNQWFEEYLCETASLFTLKRLSATWSHEAPKRDWIGYGQVFAAYADNLLAQPHRHLPPSQSLGRWYEENQSALRESPYLREKNELVASALLSLFERDPGMWQAITYLNADLASAAKPFAQYLADWHAACPRESKPVVAHAMSLFGLAPGG